MNPIREICVRKGENPYFSQNFLELLEGTILVLGLIASGVLLCKRMQSSRDVGKV